MPKTDNASCGASLMMPSPTKGRWAPITAGLAGLGAALVLGLSGCAAGTSAARAQCEGLEKLTLAGGQVVQAKLVGGGFKMSWKTIPIGVWGLKQPQSCRVSLVLTPSPDSNIKTEVWLPANAVWNNRLFGVGNGGLAGSIDRLSMGVALSHNYAVAATDTGHEAKDTDGAWALNHPEKLKDFGWRAIHETAVAAKTVIAAYYGRPQRYAYFASGSNGGREGLMEAQRFPEDYDGIVAGAPAFDGTNNIASAAWMQTRLLRSPDSYILKAKLPAVAAAVLKACDGIDGVRDGLIEDPMLCRFDPATLTCPGAESDQCLTAPQVESLRAIYDGPGGAYGDSRNWGYPRGGEESWKLWIIGDGPRKSIQYHYALEFPRYLVYGDPTWELSRFDIAKDRGEIVRLMGPDYAARDADLSRFKARGGKLILYHGWSDPALTPNITIDYFDRLQATMGKDQAAGFSRLYMAPGVWHVIGGPGPNVFGQLPTGNAVDARHSVTAAVEQWVEKGVAPQEIVASKYANDLKPHFLAGSMKPIRTRLLCPYPLVQRYSGKGSIDDAANFSCGPAGQGK